MNSSNQLAIGLNCLSYSHKVSNCTSDFKCEHCHEKHNSLLCLKQKKSTSSANVTDGNDLQSVPPIPSTSDGRFSNVDISTNTSSVSEPELNENTIFPTALVKVLNENGNYVILRAMIDNCSDASYITESAVRRLKLPIKPSEFQVSGLSNSPTAKTVGLVSFEIQSMTDCNFIKPISAFVLTLISSNRPSKNFVLKEDLNQFENLADPTFNTKSRIDLLLGGAIDAAIHKTASVKLVQENIVLRDLGWIISGSVPELNCFSSVVENSVEKKSEGLEMVLKSLDDSITRFWELEEVPRTSRLLSYEERLCEHIYNKTTVRNESGRYSVSLPLKGKLSNGFISMRNIALSRFAQLERKLSRNLELYKQYKDCMDEYLELGHMTLVDPADFNGGYYIPHHCVIKQSSSTTKLRVVYDASAKDTNLQSLNDNLLNGPRLQFELLDHLVRFRFFRIVFTADIEKMYRKIDINPNDMTDSSKWFCGDLM